MKSISADNITDRQRQVLAILAEGRPLSRRQIGERLGVKESTIRDPLLYLWRRGLVELPWGQARGTTLTAAGREALETEGSPCQN